MLGVFFKDKSEYTNKLNPIKGYLEQLTKYISVNKNLSLEQAKTVAVKIIKDKFKDRTIKYFERLENGDRIVKDGTLMSYMKENLTRNNILAPTFTSYLSTKVKKSILSEYISGNVVKRSAAKKIAQKAKAEGNKMLFLAKNNEQSSKKTDNNSLSGVFSQVSCILHNPTAHNTLTSITRTVTSLSNASNELLITGNRYYPRPKDVLNNIIYISTYSDKEAIKRVVDTFGLKLPTVEETVKVLKYSSDLYFFDDRYYQNKIIPYLNNLSPYELAGICYMGDLYHIRTFNDKFMRTLLEELINQSDLPESKLDNVNDIHKTQEALLYLVHQIFYSRIKGKGKDYEKMNESGLASGILNTCAKLEKTFYKYKDFFNVFFMSGIFPPNSTKIKNMRRRTVVLSDTDSTCFTLDEWAIWYKGSFHIDDKSIALAGCISYIASQAIVNSLAILSKNMNVDEDLLFTLAMKNEFLWLIHVPAEVSKHYYALTAICEGNVYADAELEIKGVHLKNSAVPKHIIEDARDLMKHILDTVSSNNKIKLNDIIKHIVELEKEIAESVKKGETKYLKKSKIKNKEAYSKDETKSPFQRHQLWVDVFSPKYGEIQNPPYDVVKIPTTVVKKANLASWINSIEDQELKGRLDDWMTRYNKKCLPTMYLNEIYVLGNGVPDEIIKVIDIKRIIMDITIQHRLILETLGILLRSNLMISEQFLNI